MKRSLFCMLLLIAMILCSCAPADTGETGTTTAAAPDSDPDPAPEKTECEHVLSDPTCTMPARCTLCKRPFGSSLGHDWKNGACAVCGVADSMAQKTEGIVRIVCVGDSITKGGYWNNLFGGRLDASQYEVLGFGVNGATGLAAGYDGNMVPLGYVTTDEYTLSLRNNPDIVVIMLGTNDSKGMNANRIRADEGEQYKKDMIDLINSYKELPAAPKIFLALPATIYRDPGAGTGINDPALVEVILPLLETVAAETGAILIDVHTATQGKSEMFPDGVHPNADGKDLLAQIVAEAILGDAE